MALVFLGLYGCGKSAAPTSEEFQEDPATEAIARMIIGAVNTSGTVTPNASSSCKVNSTSFQSDHYRCDTGCDGSLFRATCATNGLHQIQCGSERFDWTDGSFVGTADFTAISWINGVKPVGSQKADFVLRGDFSNPLIAGKLECQVHATLNFSPDRDLPAIDLNCESTRCALDSMPIDCRALREYLVVNLCEQL